MASLNQPHGNLNSISTVWYRWGVRYRDLGPGPHGPWASCWAEPVLAGLGRVFVEGARPGQQIFVFLIFDKIQNLWFSKFLILRSHKKCANCISTTFDRLDKSQAKVQQQISNSLAKVWHRSYKSLANVQPHVLHKSGHMYAPTW